MADVIIDYKSIISALSSQFSYIWESLVNDASTSDDDDFVREIKAIKGIEIADEQSFVKKRKEGKLEPGFVYIAVKFGVGSIALQSSVTPVSFYCVGTQNKIKPVQLLLSVFSSEWTTKNLAQGLDDEMNDILQVWNTPEVMTNFNEVNEGFRSLFRVTGNLVIGPNAVRVGELTYYWGTGEGEYETIRVLSFQDGYRTSLDSQPFGNTYGFVESEVNFSTYTFTVSTFFLANHLSADLLAIRGFRNRNSGTISSTFDPNAKMHIVLKFTNGFDNNDSFFGYFKVVDSSIGQELGGIPTINMTFTH